MKWKLYSRVAVALCAAALCGSTYGDVVLVEHAGYQEGQDDDYYVTWVADVPYIEIREPSTTQLGPYDFECYDDATGPPETAATIGSITALPNIGDVAIKVCGHGDRKHGAWDVHLLQLNQAGVNSSVEEFSILAELGARGATEVDEISGLFSVDQFLNDLDIGTTTADADLDVVTAKADLNITGPGPHSGSLVVGSLPASGDPPEDHGIDITGEFLGTLQVGHLL